MQLEDELRTLCTSLYGGEAERGGPLPLDASRLDFPTAAGGILLENYNEGELLEALRDPGRIVQEAPAGGALPTGYPPRPLDQWLEYLERVDSARGLCVLGEEDVPH